MAPILIMKLMMFSGSPLARMIGVSAQPRLMRSMATATGAGLASSR